MPNIGGLGEFQSGCFGKWLSVIWLHNVCFSFIFNLLKRSCWGMLWAQWVLGCPVSWGMALGPFSRATGAETLNFLSIPIVMACSLKEAGCWGRFPSRVWEVTEAKQQGNCVSTSATMKIPHWSIVQENDGLFWGVICFAYSVFQNTIFGELFILL